MQNLAIYPGTFDPITLGHVNIVERASLLFDRVVVGIAASQQKAPLFSLEQRQTLACQALEHIDNVRVETFSNLLVDFATEMGANVIVRGLRAVSDFEFEFQLASTNRRLAPKVETLFLTPLEEYTFVSSSLVREIAQFGGNVQQFVPQCVFNAIADQGSDYEASEPVG